MENMPFENRININLISDTMEAVKSEIGKVVVGQHEAIELMLTAILADGHILLEGVPGVAKTLTAKLIAKSIDVDFSRVQFTPDLMPSDVMGTNVFNPQKVSFEFKKGPIFSNLVLIDEINRAPAKTQAALFEVMEEKTITVDGISYPLEPPFIVIATQNPVEHEGTYQLPEAQLDRFMFKIIIDYPSQEHEIEVLQRHQNNHNMHQLIHLVHKILDAAKLTELRSLVSQVNVENKLLHFITQIVHQTRNNNGLLLGASPRASIAILNAAKALATLRGRDFVTPEDIIYVATPALRHRISLSAEKEMDGTTTDDIIHDIIKGIEIPR
jgi:MoxR-like ATPase